MERQKMVQVGFRFPEQIVAALDRVLERRNQAHPGQTVTRADLVRGFVILGLQEEQAEVAARRKAGKRRGS